jgi:oxygen-independent coproporphyrinogen-3 oxidase
MTPSQTTASMSLGIYISVPFCRSKCTYCNFASGVFSPGLYEEYCALLSREITLLSQNEGLRGADVDSIYLGGGTPTLLPPASLSDLVQCLRSTFSIRESAEFTIEAAPGTLNPPVIDALVAAGMNRVSLGVQSFVDREVRSVARLHRRDVVLADLQRLRASGITNFNLDLIAGLPYQTEGSWNESLDIALATEAPHISVYMLEVDEDSRLGTELLAGGARYHAHHVPDEELVADFYERACDRLETAGIAQYEISNFARPAFESRHNQRYWLRQPYAGFGVDAHSMLFFPERRWANQDNLEGYLSCLHDSRLARTEVHSLSPREQLEETLFLGLRINIGVDLADIENRFGQEKTAEITHPIEELVSLGLLEQSGSHIRLTRRGRLLSNEVFARFVGDSAEQTVASL